MLLKASPQTLDLPVSLKPVRAEVWSLMSLYRCCLLRVLASQLMALSFSSKKNLLPVIGHVGIGLHHQPQRVLVGSHGECSIIDTVNTEGGVRIQSHAIAVFISIGKQLKLNFHHVQPVFRIDSDTHSLKAFRESQISHLAYGVMSIASLMMRFGVVSYGPPRVSRIRVVHQLWSLHSAKVVLDEHCAGRRKARFNPLNVELVRG